MDKSRRHENVSEMFLVKTRIRNMFYKARPVCVALLIVALQAPGGPTRPLAYARISGRGLNGPVALFA